MVFAEGKDAFGRSAIPVCHCLAVRFGINGHRILFVEPASEVDQAAPLRTERHGGALVDIKGAGANWAIKDRHQDISRCHANALGGLPAGGARYFAAAVFSGFAAGFDFCESPDFLVSPAAAFFSASAFFLYDSLR